MIIASEGESVCVALWPDEAAGAVDEEEDEDDVGGSDASGCGGVGAGSSAAGVWRLYEGLPYGDARSDAEAASPSGYLRFLDADGGVSGGTAGNRTSSLVI